MDKFSNNYRKRSRSRERGERARGRNRIEEKAERHPLKRSKSSSSNSSSRSSSLLSSQSSHQAKGEWNISRQKFQENLRDRQSIEVPFNLPVNNTTEESYDRWKIKEDQFHLEQAILRSKIRINSNREKPIDFIAKVILIIEGKLPVTSDFLSDDYKSPFNIFNHVHSSIELRELLNEMQTFLNVNKDNIKFQQYWQSMQRLCNLEIEKKVKIEQESNITDE